MWKLNVAGREFRENDDRSIKHTDLGHFLYCWASISQHRESAKCHKCTYYMVTIDYSYIIDIVVDNKGFLWPLICRCVFVCDHLAGVKLSLYAVLHGQVLHSPSRPLQADLRFLQTHLQLQCPLTADIEQPVSRRPSTRVPSFTCDLDNHTETLSRRTQRQRFYVADKGCVIETGMLR